MKQFKVSFLLLFLVCSFSSISYAAGLGVLISAEVGGSSEVSIASTLSANLVGITPNYTWVDTPNVVPTSQDPWLIAAPFAASINVANNVVNNNLYIYTNHRSLADLSQIPSDANLNGLLNFATVSKNATYKSVAPMRAWVDYNDENTVTTNSNANWVWVSDGIANKQPLFLDYQKLVQKNNLGIYLRSCWNTPKNAGAYNAKIILLWDPQ